jgi:hypothetical protein
MFGRDQLLPETSFTTRLQLQVYQGDLHKGEGILDFYEFKFGLKESLAAIGNENS